MDASIKHDGYQLHDPRCDALYYFHTANAATAKADELGASRFQFRSADDHCMWVHKRSGQWVREDDQPLDVIQKRMDEQTFLDLSDRAMLRLLAPEDAQDVDEDRPHALADIFALRAIQAPALRQRAVAWMVRLATDSEHYRARLETARRVVPDSELTELNAALAAIATEA